MGGGRGNDLVNQMYGASGVGSASQDLGLSDKVMTQINDLEKVSSRLACDCNHGIMIEVMKKFMFKS